MQFGHCSGIDHSCADVTAEERQACKPGENAELDCIIAQLQPSAQAPQAAAAVHPTGASRPSGSSDTDANSSTILRAVQELLPLLSTNDLQQVARTVQKLL